MAKGLLGDDSSSEDDLRLEPVLKVNAEYAKKFEYNKKLEEKQKLEDKYKQPSRKRKRGEEAVSSTESDSEGSSSEDEDSEGEFATEALDGEIAATLHAIRSKDPRVYDEKATFYTEFDESAAQVRAKREKPIYLQDYQRQNLLNGVQNQEQNGDEPMTYVQEQEMLKSDFVSQMHAAAANDSEVSGSDDEFMVRKPRSKATQPARPTIDVSNADRDPETFLSNFMAARAWVPTDKVQQHVFESDDDEQEERAEVYEEAFNMRFEAPEKSNEVLRTYGREAVQKHSVRRDDLTVRQKKREAERAVKEAAKQQRKEEKQRLKRLRMEDMEQKLGRIKKASGLRTEDIQPEDWQHFISDDWDDEQWEQEMQRRFGQEYYEEEYEQVSDADDSSRKKLKKPKFDDDIDINDIIPDFKLEDNQIQLSEAEDELDNPPRDSLPTSKKDRRIISQLIDDQISLSLDSLPSKSQQKGSGFRYRETSPTSFGLTARDILLADDAALNTFVGLKKLGAFRDPVKKAKDRKHLGKKARLRQWRMDTFGSEEGMEGKTLSAAVKPDSDQDGGVDIREGGKRKRRRKKKGLAV